MVGVGERRGDAEEGAEEYVGLAGPAAGGPVHALHRQQRTHLHLAQVRDQRKVGPFALPADGAHQNREHHAPQGNQHPRTHGKQNHRVLLPTPRQLPALRRRQKQEAPPLGPPHREEDHARGRDHPGTGKTQVHV